MRTAPYRQSAREEPPPPRVDRGAVVSLLPTVLLVGVGLGARAWLREPGSTVEHGVGVTLVAVVILWVVRMHFRSRA